MLARKEWPTKLLANGITLLIADWSPVGEGAVWEPAALSSREEPGTQGPAGPGSNLRTITESQQPLPK